MLIECLCRMEEFESVRADWERVYAPDPDADYFRSWGRLCAWLEDTWRPWFVPAVRRDESEESTPGGTTLGGSTPEAQKRKPDEMIRRGQT